MIETSRTYEEKKTYLYLVESNSQTTSQNSNNGSWEEIKSTSSTLRDDLASKKRLQSLLTKLSNEAREEIFEDGMDSLFSKCLSLMLATYKNRVIQIIGDISFLNLIDPEVASEILITLARNDDIFTYRDRFRVITSALKLSSPIAREGSILALEMLNDKNSISILEKAINTEQSSYLKNEMRAVIDSLRC